MCLKKLLNLFYCEGVDKINRANETALNTSEACCAQHTQAQNVLHNN